MNMKTSTVTSVAMITLLLCGSSAVAFAETPPAPKGVYAFGGDQTIADLGKMEWAPLQLQGLPPGIEIVSLRGDLAKGGGEIVLRTPPKYVVPNHSHTSDETYVWLKGDFTYVAADGTRQKITSPAFISLPGNTPHALECGDEPCVVYLRYGRSFDLDVHTMPAMKPAR
jgi:quercetin dioxygenase-like cupin family protein